ncbi:nuclease S1 [Neokomagataea thailandica NBRC 106555]|uniref:Nuclease n=2 Tax=Neokomagataea TaxID=1223423 RepID=A0A4Y6V511_9PROT|nr:MULTISPECIES: S1/P1 nuclease [Neokomagataea]QDH25013.1 nuclease [Neokomagataea tanensis]GBR51498.1 nuclease S1 [Neokomagataea thailandica NBRC 106555]
MRRWFLGVASTVLGLGLLHTSAYAWGPYGHAMVADIAQERLTPQAAAAVHQLLALEGHKSLDQVASWPDTMGHLPVGHGGHPETLKWHYVDTDVVNPAYVHERDCADSNCVVERLPEEIALLSNVHAAPAVRLEALKWVVHLVGDLHQPLHAAERDHDMGGNTIHLTYYGESAHGHMNLHALWDEGILNRQDHLVVGPHYSIDYSAAGAAAQQLSAQITPEQVRYWTQDLSAPGAPYRAVMDWVDESHELARSVAYGALPSQDHPDLGDTYTAVAWPIIQLRLEQAGVRLAGVLNQSLGQ